MASYSSQGTKISIKNGATYDLIGQVRQISGPALKAETIDVTDIAGTWKSYLPGSLDGGEITLELILDPADTQHVALRTALTTRAKNDFKIEWTQTDPDKNVTFSAYVTAMEFSASVDEALTASVTLRVTGEVTFG